MNKLTNLHRVIIKWFRDPIINSIVDLIYRGLSFDQININYDLILKEDRLSIIKRINIIKLFKNKTFRSKPDVFFLNTILYGTIPPKTQKMFVQDENTIIIGETKVNRYQCWQLKWIDCPDSFIDFLLTGETKSILTKFKSQKMINENFIVGRSVQTQNIMNVRNDLECSVIDCDQKSCGKSRFTDGADIYWIYVCRRHIFGKFKFKISSDKSWQKEYNPKEEIV